jgi:hypothetical protein
MEGKRRKQVWDKELPEFSSSETRDGVLVRVRCVEISRPADPQSERSRSPRYEIYIEARGLSAIADVPAEDHAMLSSRVDEVVSAFVDSIRLRAGSSAPT